MDRYPCPSGAQPKKAGNKPRRRERVYKRTAKVQRGLLRKRRRSEMSVPVTFVKRLRLTITLERHCPIPRALSSSDFRQAQSFFPTQLLNNAAANSPFRSFVLPFCFHSFVYHAFLIYAISYKLKIGLPKPFQVPEALLNKNGGIQRRTAPASLRRRPPEITLATVYGPRPRAPASFLFSESRFSGRFPPWCHGRHRRRWIRRYQCAWPKQTYR